MALTVAKITGADHVAGNKRYKYRTITFDASYPTGGEPLTASDLGLKQIVAIVPMGAFRNTDATLGIEVSYDHTNSKLVAYWGNAGVASGMPEVTSTTDLSTYSGRIMAIGV